MSSFGLKNLELAEVPVPTPNKNCSPDPGCGGLLNYRDKLVVEGALLPDKPAMPFVPVSDMAGEVVYRSATCPAYLPW